MVQGGTGRKAQVVLGVALVAALLAGCDSGSTTHRSEGEEVGSPRQFCNARAQREVSTSLGVEMLRSPKAETAGPRFSCRYEFADGTIAVSVSSFPSTSAARRRMAEIANDRGRRPEPPMLGEDMEAFMTTNGSMIVRKNRDVLDVDVAGLPAQFGRPPQAPSLIALATAVTIIGHWVPG